MPFLIDDPKKIRMSLVMRNEPIWKLDTREGVVEVVLDDDGAGVDELGV